MKKIINAPLSTDCIRSLKAGDFVYINGEIYTGRDAAHKRLFNMIKNDENMPFDFDGSIIFYAGPCPNRPGQVIGSIGPTTSTRMDAYSPLLIKNGLRAMIGKGLRNSLVINAIKEYTGIYFAAIGGAAALMSGCVKRSEVIAFDDLGTEAIRRLYVEELPVIVAVDFLGNSVYSCASDSTEEIHV